MPVAEHLVKTFKAAAADHGLSGASQVVREVVRESVRRKKFRRSQFSLREAAEKAMGPGWELQLEAYARRQGAVQSIARESATDPSVDVTAFSETVGSVMSDEIEDAWEAATSDVENLVSTYPTPNSLREKVIDDKGVATDKAQTVGEAQEYPKTGVTGNRTTIPAAEKIGLLADVTLEATIEDEVAERLDLARMVGDEVGQEWRERIWKVILGIVNNFKRNGTSYNTYSTSSPWGSNKLTDFDQADGPAEFDRLDMLFEGMVNPNTGRPVKVGGDRDILVPRANYLRTRSTVNTQEIRTTTGGVEVVQGNPVGGLSDPMTDPYIVALLTAAGYTTTEIANFVLYGDFDRAFSVRIVRPFEVLERDMETASDVGFRQDIVYAAKARIIGAPFVRRPWHVAMAYKS